MVSKKKNAKETISDIYITPCECLTDRALVWKESGSEVDTVNLSL